MFNKFLNSRFTIPMLVSNLQNFYELLIFLLISTYFQQQRFNQTMLKRFLRKFHTISKLRLKIFLNNLIFMKWIFCYQQMLRSIILIGWYNQIFSLIFHSPSSSVSKLKLSRLSIHLEYKKTRITFSHFHFISTPSFSFFFFFFFFLLFTFIFTPTSLFATDAIYHVKRTFIWVPSLLSDTDVTLNNNITFS